jgi:thiol-disulfide isomerase/thioredoxin
MLRKASLVGASLAALLAAVASVVYVGNPTPTVPTISSEDAPNAGKPYVVKLHARWCPVCMLTKPMWPQIEAAYSGRANLVVFDFTNGATTDVSLAEARRLGLEKIFDENAGWTGTILIVDGHTKEEVASIHGSRNFDDYRVAIDAALRAAAR